MGCPNTYLYYYNNGDASGGIVSTCGLYLSDHETNHTLGFFDAPRDACLPFVGPASIEAIAAQWLRWRRSSERRKHRPDLQ